MYVYKRLKNPREDHDLNQAKAAKILNTSQQQYSRWERGEQEIPLHLAIMLAQYYHVSLDYLVGLPRGLPYGYSVTAAESD